MWVDVVRTWASHLGLARRFPSFIPAINENKARVPADVSSLNRLNACRSSQTSSGRQHKVSKSRDQDGCAGCVSLLDTEL